MLVYDEPSSKRKKVTESTVESPFWSILWVIQIHDKGTYWRLTGGQAFHLARSLLLGKAHLTGILVLPLHAQGLHRLKVISKSSTSTSPSLQCIISPLLVVKLLVCISLLRNHSTPTGLLCWRTNACTFGTERHSNDPCKPGSEKEIHVSIVEISNHTISMLQVSRSTNPPPLSCLL